jgi:hypothetical protein
MRRPDVSQPSAETRHRDPNPPAPPTLFDVLTRQGTVALAGFTGALVLFLVLHLARLPLLITVRVIEASMRRINAYATAAYAAAPEFTAPPARQEDRVHAYAA